MPDGAISIVTSVSGTLIAGEMYSLMCTVQEEILGLTGEPMAVWMDSNGNVMEGDDLTVTSSNGMSTIAFNPLKPTNADTYTCTGSLQSPALSTPLTVTQQQRVEVTRELIAFNILLSLSFFLFCAVPTPGVSLSSPPSSLIAGTSLTLNCTIILDPVVDVNVVVDIVSEKSTNNGDHIMNTFTATGSTVQQLFINPLSTMHTAVTCRATVRRPSTDPFVLTSSQGMDTVTLTVQGEYIPYIF